MRSNSLNVFYFFRRNKYFFIGCLIGISLSSIFMPVLRDCDRSWNLQSFESASERSSSQQRTATAADNHDTHLLQRVQYWFFEVQRADFEPILMNTSIIDDENRDIHSGEDIRKEFTFDHPGDFALVRDKKLKFYRPRFHHTELNIKRHLLLCVVFTERALTFSLAQKPNNQSMPYFIKQLINDHFNQIKMKVSNHNDVDLVYLYPEIKNEQSIANYSNWIVSAIEGHRWNRISLNDPNNQTNLHAVLIRSLMEMRKLNQYSFVYMFTHQTLISVDRFLEYISEMSVSDNVLSIGAPENVKNYKNLQRPNRLYSDFGVNDSILDYGLLVSSSLLLRCQLDLACLDAESNAQTLASNTYNAFYLNNSVQMEIFALNEIEAHRESISQVFAIYPIPPNSELSFRIDLLFGNLRINELRKQCESKVEYKLALANIMVNEVWPASLFGRQKARNRYEINRWTFWNATHAFMPDDLRVIRPLNQFERSEIVSLQAISQQWLNAQKWNRLWTNVSIENVYRKFCAVRGLEYLLDVKQTSRSLSHQHQPEKRMRLQVLKPLNPIELMPDVPYSTENVRLTLILPVRGRHEVPLAIKFLNQYANVCLTKANHQTMLIIVLIYTRHLNLEESIESILEFEKNEFERLKNVSLYIQSKFSANSVKIAFLDLHPPDVSSDALDASYNTSRISRYPSELVYLDLIARSLRASSSEPFLMLHCRTNMLFSTDFLNRVRLNTITSRQIFFPIPFVEYRLRSTSSNNNFRKALHVAPNRSTYNDLIASIAEMAEKAKNSYFDVRKENGYFDDGNFELASFYLSDYLAVRQATERWLPLVRNHQSIVKHRQLYYGSSVDLHHLFTSSSQLHSNAAVPPLVHMRAVEPELRLQHSSVLSVCARYESNVHAFDNCMYRQLNGLAPKQKLASIVIEYLEISRNESRGVR